VVTPCWGSPPLSLGGNRNSEEKTINEEAKETSLTPIDPRSFFQKKLLSLQIIEKGITKNGTGTILLQPIHGPRGKTARREKGGQNKTNHRWSERALKLFIRKF
jgi:hypothetical protein